MLENLDLTLEDLKNPQVLRVLFSKDGSDLIDIFKVSDYLETFILNKKDRRENGVYFTPKILVDLLISSITFPMTRDLKVIDTANGIGNILISFARVYAGHRMAYAKKIKKGQDYKYFLGETYRECIYGIEMEKDFTEIMLTVMSLDSGFPIKDLAPNFICSDFFEVTSPFLGKKFDVLLANPPYITGIRSEVATDLKGVTNLSFEYINRSINLLKPEYQIGLIMPAIFLSASTFKEQRRSWIEGHNLNKVWLCDPSLRAFKDANVNVCVASINTNRNLIPQFLSFPNNTRQGKLNEMDISNWSSAYYGDLLKPCKRLKDDFEVHSGLIVSEAYICLPHIVDDLTAEGKKFITSGMVEPFSCSWGTKNRSILKKIFRYPKLTTHIDFSKSLNEKILSTRPKIIVPGLVMKIKTMLDDSGEYISGAGTYVIYHKRDNLEELIRLCEHLNTSEEVHNYFISILETKRIGQGGYPISKTFLEGIPCYE